MGSTLKEDVLDPTIDLAFPESVVGLFKGELGIPEGGFPQALSDKVLQGAKPDIKRPGAHLPPVDFDKVKSSLEQQFNQIITNTDLASYLMYPKVFSDYLSFKNEFGDVSTIPTAFYFYPLPDDVDISIDIEKGKTLLIRLLAVSEPDATGFCQVFFELNGEQRTLKVAKKGLESLVKKHTKIDSANKTHVGAPMPGMVGKIHAKEGSAIKEGDPILVMEAMKMETVLRAEYSGVVQSILVITGDTVDTHDLRVNVKSGVWTSGGVPY